MIDWLVKTPDLFMRLRNNNKLMCMACGSTESAIPQIVVTAEATLKFNKCHRGTPRHQGGLQ